MLQTYTIGDNKIPEWVGIECLRGRLKINYNENNKIESITISSVGSIKIAKKGDVIYKNINGIGILPPDKHVKSNEVVKEE